MVASKKRGAAFLLPDDNVPLRRSRIAQAKIREYGFEELNRPLYTPHQAKSTIFSLQIWNQSLREAIY